MRLVELIQPGAGVAWGSGVWGTGYWGVGDLVTPLPVGLVLKDNSLDYKVDREDLLFADGRISYGEEVEERKLVVEGRVDADSRAELLDLLNALRYQCHLPGQRLRINPGHFINLARLRSFEDEAEAGFDRTVSRVKVEWQVDDPFWYAEALESRTFAISGDTTIVVDLSALPKCYRGQHPLIKIESPVYLPVGSVQLTNTSDENMSLRYSDPYLGFGNYATIDCVTGTATRSDGQTTIRYLEGEFLRLVPGVNNIAYVGPACTLTLTWRHRWL